MDTRIKARSLFDPPIVRRAIIDALLKLDPRHQVKNPVMFVVEVGSVLTSATWLLEPDHAP
jgi:K+-transporting ATPase ATPase B chain